MPQQMQVGELRPEAGVGLFYIQVGFTPLTMAIPWPPPEQAKLGLEKQSKLASANGGALNGKVQDVPFARMLVLADVKLAVYGSDAVLKELARREDAILAEQVLARRDALAAAAKTNGHDAAPTSSPPQATPPDQPAP